MSTPSNTSNPTTQIIIATPFYHDYGFTNDIVVPPLQAFYDSDWEPAITADGNVIYYWPMWKTVEAVYIPSMKTLLWVTRCKGTLMMTKVSGIPGGRIGNLFRPIELLPSSGEESDIEIVARLPTPEAVAYLLSYAILARKYSKKVNIKVSVTIYDSIIAEVEEDNETKKYEIDADFKGPLFILRLTSLTP